MDEKLRNEVKMVADTIRGNNPNPYPSPEEADELIMALIASYSREARLDELEKFTHSEGSIHLLAEKVSYQPANHDPIHSWPIINGKVIIVSQDYLKDRIKTLKEGK